MTEVVAWMAAQAVAHVPVVAQVSLSTELSCQPACVSLQK
jgi:hypothetical protein